MYSLDVRKSEKPNTVLSRNMKPGQIGTIVVGTYKGTIVLRTYGTLVSLSNPELDWTSVGSTDIEIELLPKNSVVEIKIG